MTKSQAQNGSLTWKQFKPVFLVICSLFYLGIYLGWFLSKLFYQLFDIFATMNKKNSPEIIKFRKKFNLKNVIKYILRYFGHILIQWLLRAFSLVWLATEAFEQALISTLEFIGHFMPYRYPWRIRFKSFFEIRRIFELLKVALLNYWDMFLVFWSLAREWMAPSNFIESLILWKSLLFILMKESILLNTFGWVLFFLLLFIFGILLGFLFGIYRRENEIYMFALLFFLKLLHSGNFDKIILSLLPVNSLELTRPENFFTTEVLDTTYSSSSKLLLEPVKNNHPFPEPLLSDLFIWVDIDIIQKEKEANNFQFQLVKFYHNVNKKIKS